MTRIKRPQRSQQRLTLAGLGAGLLGITALSYCLFQMDGFPQRRKHLRTVVLTPDHLFVGGRQTLRDSTESVSSDVKTILRSSEDDEESKNLEEEKALPVPIAEADEEVPEGGHRFRMAIHSGLDDSEIGTVLFQTRPDWAPIGADHFHKLVEAKFYDECRFFRVVKNFIVQFGIAGDPEVQKKWRKDVLQDDPVKQTNKRGTITYAMSGENSRTTQLFVNTSSRPQGNKYLDGQGFAPFAEVLEGMEFIDMVNG